MKFLILCALVGLSVAQFPHQLPPMQIQIPIQRPIQPIAPQQPLAPPQQRPAPPNFPRNDWREGIPDTRCPVPDDHEGWAFFLPGDANAPFYKCWGGLRFPYECARGSPIWDNELQACITEAQAAARRPIGRPNWPNFRPFEENEDEN